MKLKPSLKNILPNLLMLAILVFTVIFFSLLIFGHDPFITAWNFSIFITMLCVIIAFLSVLPAFILESLSLGKETIIFDNLFSKTSIPIAEIIELEERIGFGYKRYSPTLTIKTRKKSLNIAYKKYSEAEIKKFIQQQLIDNPKIRNDFQIAD